jgi:hypothetical protein
LFVTADQLTDASSPKKYSFYCLVSCTWLLSMTRLFIRIEYVCILDPLSAEESVHEQIDIVDEHCLRFHTA